MVELRANNQVSAFRRILELENRSQQVDDIIGRLKHSVLGSPGNVSVPDAVGILDEMRWHLNTMAEQLVALERSIGIRRQPVAKKPTDENTEVNHSLRGSTKTIRLPDLIALLSMQRKTGTLWIKADSQKFILEMLEGAIVHAVCARECPCRGRARGSSRPRCRGNSGHG